jgi:hypothetical protein
LGLESVFVPRCFSQRFAALLAVAALLVTSVGVVAAETTQFGFGGRAGAGQIARQLAATQPQAPLGENTLLHGAVMANLSPDIQSAMTARVGLSIERRGVAGLAFDAPYLSQMDGTTYADGNCGPAALAMALGAFGHLESVHALRESINGQTGDWGIDSGTTWQALQQAAQTRGFAITSPFNPDGALRTWTLDEMLAETAAGRPVLVLVKYQSLPGHEQAEWWGDHYVTVLGTTPDGRIVYHDSAFRGVAGAYRTIDRERFIIAWSQTWIGENWSAMVVNGRG